MVFQQFESSLSAAAPEGNRGSRTPAVGAVRCPSRLQNKLTLGSIKETARQVAHVVVEEERPEVNQSSWALAVAVRQSWLVVVVAEKGAQTTELPVVPESCVDAQSDIMGYSDLKPPLIGMQVKRYLFSSE